MGWVVEERQLASGEAFFVRRTYDLMGDVVQRTTSLGHSAAFARDACGRVTQVVLDGRTTVGVAHDALGREIARALPDGGRIQVVYDDRYLYVAIRCEDGSPGSIGAGLGRRDELPTTDYVSIGFDPRHDHLTGTSSRPTHPPSRRTSR